MSDFEFDASQDLFDDPAPATVGPVVFATADSHSSSEDEEVLTLRFFN